MHSSISWSDMATVLGSADKAHALAERLSSETGLPLKLRWEPD
jgi:hypothetical protein